MGQALALTQWAGLPTWHNLWLRLGPLRNPRQTAYFTCQEDFGGEPREGKTMPMADEGVTIREIRVQVVENRQSGLLVALSDDLKGLMVAARTEEQIEEELPAAIREMLEAAGHH